MGLRFEHNSFRFHIRAPIFVAREWMRHRVGCLTGDTEVTFVDVNGDTTPKLRKTIDELWHMWSVGERNGHALSSGHARQVDELFARGRSIRSIARELKIGRRAIRSHLDGNNSHRDSRWRLRKMRLRVLNEETNEFESGHIREIFDKGVQPIYRLTLADGKQLTATLTHRLLTSEGWLTMQDALGVRGEGEAAAMTRDCRLLTNGEPAHQSYDWMKARREAGLSVQQIAAEAGCSYHTVRKWLAVHDLRFSKEEQYKSRVPWNRGLRYRTGRRLSPEHKEAIRRARSGERSNFWRGGISSRRQSIGRWTREQAARVHEQYHYVCQSCGARGGRLHAHHIIPVWLDEATANDVGNLISVCDRCHRRIHRTFDAETAFAQDFAGSIGFAQELPKERRRGWKLTARPVAVVALEYLGLRQTYDLSVEGPWHNFVANGMVVHNSFNEFSLRYAKATDDFYVPEPDDVRSQVGKPGAYSFEPVPPEVAETTREQLQAVYEKAYETYQELVELGVARELARCVLPVGAYTEFYWTVNARSLMNFISLRNAETAQREIRRYAAACEQFLEQKMPVTYAAFVASGRVAP